MRDLSLIRALMNSLNVNFVIFLFLASRIFGAEASDSQWIVWS